VLENTKVIAVATPTESGVFSRPEFAVMGFPISDSYGRDGQSGNTWRMAITMFSTSCPPALLENCASGIYSLIGEKTMTATTGKLPTTTDALRQILTEVTPGTRPFSTDSYLPAHLVQTAFDALALHDSEASQHAYNALSTAAWHCARGEPGKALSRMRRAQSHISASMEGRA
jgi:hypothetical protein